MPIPEELSEVGTMNQPYRMSKISLDTDLKKIPSKEAVQSSSPNIAGLPRTVRIFENSSPLERKAEMAKSYQSQVELGEYKRKGIDKKRITMKKGIFPHYSP